MTTLTALHAEMHRYNRHAAYGSECNAWQDFVADCFEQLGCAPWADEPKMCPGDFSAYWLAVANGESSDYDPETGARRETVEAEG